jgi:glycerol-3-phosphate acyltransferase PlsY
MKKTWKLINELSSKNIGKTNRVSELNFNNQEITAPMDMLKLLMTIFRVLVTIWLHLYQLLTMIRAFILKINIFTAISYL